MFVVAPIESTIDDDRLRHRLCAVLRVGPPDRLTATAIPIHFIAPFQIAMQGQCIRVDQQLVHIEPMSLARCVLSVCTKSVVQTGAGIWQESMPDVARLRRKTRPGYLLSRLGIEQAELKTLRVRRDHGEVDTLACATRSQWLR